MEYLALTGSKGIFILDVSDSEYPEVVSRLKLKGVSKVYSDGDHAYVSSGKDLVILDISDPEDPKILSRLSVGLEIVNVIASKGYVYLVADDISDENSSASRYLMVINISDPKNPKIKGKASVEMDYKEDYEENRENICNMCISENRVYIPMGDESGITVFDVSDPENPKLEKKLLEGETVFKIYKTSKGNCIAVEKSSILVYKDEGFDEVLREIYIKGDGIPLLDTILRESEESEKFKDEEYEDHEDDDEYKKEEVYVILGESEESEEFEDEVDAILREFEDEEEEYDDEEEYEYEEYESEPVGIIDSFLLKRTSDEGEYLYVQVEPSAGGAYYGDDCGCRLVTIDVSDPENPRFLSRLVMEKYYKSVYAVENYVYLLNLDEIAIVDASNPEEPGFVGYKVLGGDYILVGLDEVYVYSSKMDEEKYLVVKENSSISGRVKIGDVETTDVYVNDEAGLAIVAYREIDISAKDNLRIIDISDPEHPEIIIDNLEGGIDITALNDHDNIYVYTVSENVLRVATVFKTFNDEYSAYVSNRLKFSEGVRKIYKISEDLYLLIGGESMIMDASNPEDPKIIWKMFEDNLKNVSKIHAIGNYIYIATVNNLMVLDISDKANPEIVDEIEFQNHIHDIRFLGDHAFAIGEDTLEIIDLSNKSNPKIVKRKSFGYMIDEIHFQENYAYITIDERKIVVLDISNWKKTKVIKRKTLWRTDSDYSIDKIYFLGNYAYIVSGEHLVILDLSDKTNPKIAKKINLDAFIDEIYLFEDYAYVVADEQLIVLDISDRLNPEIVNRVEFDDRIYSIHFLKDHAFVVVGSEFVIVNLSNWKDPKVIQRMSFDDVPFSKIFGNLAFVTLENELVVLDISNLENPKELARYTGIYARDILISGKYAYIATGAKGLVVVDISKPSEPKFVEETIGADFVSIDSSNGVVAAGGKTGIFIFDVSDPTELALLSRVDTRDVYDLVVANDHVYASAESGLSIIDISNPKDPKVLTTLEGVSFGKVSYYDNHVYIASGEDGLIVVDISEPKSPKVASRLEGIIAKDVYVSEGKAYIAAGDDGPIVVDVSDPKKPKIIEDMITMVLNGIYGLK